MTKSVHQSKSCPTPLDFHVGDRVRVRLSGRSVESIIVEDRGMIGVHGRRILRLKTTPDPENPDPQYDIIFEVPVDEIEATESA